jgi:hypothetical protein
MQESCKTGCARFSPVSRPPSGRLTFGRSRVELVMVSPLPVLDQYRSMSYLANHRVGNESGRTLAQVIRLLPECCSSVTSKQAATCSLLVMQEIYDNEEVGFEGGQYACTEEELYEKAIALLEKCRIETRRSGQKLPDPTAETPPTTV